MHTLKILSHSHVCRQFYWFSNRNYCALNNKINKSFISFNGECLFRLSIWLSFCGLFVVFLSCLLAVVWLPFGCRLAVAWQSSGYLLISLGRLYFFGKLEPSFLSNKFEAEVCVRHEVIFDYQMLSIQKKAQTKSQRAERYMWKSVLIRVIT